MHDWKFGKKSVCISVEGEKKLS